MADGVLCEALLARVEDASLNASAPPQQRWLDGWLLRYSPGKAKRARSIQAVAASRLALDDQLRLAAPVFDEAGLPMLFRITPFTQPGDLDATLAARGWERFDDSAVMVCPLPAPPAFEVAMPNGWRWRSLTPDRFAADVGALRESTPVESRAHAQRLAQSPVPCRCFAITGSGDVVLACGQFTREADLVGLYDIVTAPAARGRGLATALCERLLSVAASEGAQTAYLQVDSDNATARRLYARLGFIDAYRYHYRQSPAAA